MRDSVFLAVTNSNLHSDQKQKRKKKRLLTKLTQYIVEDYLCL